MEILMYIISSAVIGAALCFYILSVCHRKEKSDDNGTKAADLDTQHEADLIDLESKDQAPNECKNEKSELQEHCDKSEHELTKLLDEIENKKNELNELKREIAEHEDDLARKEQTPNECKDEKSELQEHCDKSEHEFAKLLSEIGNKNKELNKLKREIAENEDDLVRKDKKLNECKNEKSELQEQCDKSKQECTKLQSEIDDKDKELKLNSIAQEFIQEVLEAKVVDDSFTTNLYGSVDAIITFIREDIRACVKNIKGSTLDGEVHFGEKLDAWANLQKKNWIQGKTTIAFVGGFSAGKTSIVNRILSQDDPSVTLLPVATEATTAIPTYISGGVSTLFQFVSADNLLRIIREKTFKSVNKDMLGKIKGVSSLIKYFVMNYKNSNLDRMSILDTPGFSSNDKEDAERTIEVINECDALFWVIDVNVGAINQSSIDIIKSHLKKPLYIVINKVDSKYVTDVDDVEQGINTTLNNNEVKVEKIIRFSKNEPLTSLMEIIGSISHTNYNEAYIDELNKYLDSHIAQINRELKILGDEYATIVLQRRKMNEEIGVALWRIENSCRDAASIPAIRKGVVLGGAKDYRMTIDNGDQLINLLNVISEEQTKSLQASVKKATQLAEDETKAYNNKQAKSYAKKELEKCKKDLGRSIESLKKTS